MGGITVAEANKESLEGQLEWLENHHYYFWAGYLGSGEVFVLRHCCGAFIDFHQFEGETVQTFKPTQLKEAIDEATAFIRSGKGGSECCECLTMDNTGGYECKNKNRNG